MNHETVWIQWRNKCNPYQGPNQDRPIQKGNLSYLEWWLLGRYSEFYAETFCIQYRMVNVRNIGTFVCHTLRICVVFTPSKVKLMTSTPSFFISNQRCPLLLNINSKANRCTVVHTLGFLLLTFLRSTIQFSYKPFDFSQIFLAVSSFCTTLCTSSETVSGIILVKGIQFNRNVQMWWDWAYSEP